MSSGSTSIPMTSTAQTAATTAPISPPSPTSTAAIQPAPATEGAEVAHPLETSTEPTLPPKEDTAAATGTQPAAGQETATAPPEPMCHVKALVISGESHVFSFEPELTVGRMKELIWSMWPSDWTEPAQPPSPSFLRILYAGRILSDESTLASNNLPSALAPSIPTVIHISVRSFSLRPEDDPQKGSLLHPVGSRNRNNRGDDVGGCKCIIM